MDKGDADLDKGLRARLRLLATTDLHMHLAGFDYHADRPDPAGGLTRVATLIRAARQEAREQGAAVLLFDNGDGLQGSPAGETAAARPQAPHPLMQAFGLLGYDAIGLGNHDFDFGLDALAAALADAPCPVVCSNLDPKGSPAQTCVAPVALLEVGVGAPRPLSVGVLSLLPPQTVDWDRPLLEDRIAVGDMLEAARRRVRQLREMGADLIVALAHGGLGPARAVAGMENPVIPLAAIDGVDAIVGGHTHLPFPGPEHPGAGPDLAAVDFRAGSVHGKPVVMPGAGGSHLGVIDLDLHRDGSGRWVVSGAVSALHPVAQGGAGGRTVPEEPHLARLIAPVHDATRSQLAEPIGKTESPLHSYFSLFAPDRALAVVAAAQAAALRPHLAARGLEHLPLLSAAAPARSGGRGGPSHYTDVPAGPVSRRNLHSLCPYPNHLQAVIVTGAQLRDWLEHAAGLFRRVDGGEDGQQLTDPAFPGHDFDVLHGVSYAVDLSAAARFSRRGHALDGGGRRIVDLRHDGRPVEDAQQFVVALGSYRANGGGHVAALAGAEHLPLPPLPVRDAVADYLSGRIGPDPLATISPWRFVPVPGQHVSARTGPGAVRYLSEIEARGITVSGQDADGFLRLRIPL